MSLPSLTSQQMQEFANFAFELADAARSILAPAARFAPTDLRTQIKADRSFVTALDAQIEVRLRELISQRYPAHGILGEEGQAHNAGSDISWVLDPIDGTAPFIAGVPVFGTLIALAVQGKPVIGVMDFPMTDQRWLGIEGQATRLNGQVVRCRPCSDLSAAMMSNSNPDFLSTKERPALEALKSKTAWRIYGGCCLSYGLLASGRTDLALDAGFKVWDYAPFVPVIEGAGGKITDWQGQPLTLSSGSQVLAAGDAALHVQALRVVAGSLQAS